MHPCSLEDVIITSLNIKNSKYVVKTFICSIT